MQRAIIPANTGQNIDRRMVTRLEWLASESELSGEHPE
jgi:hypothetical protein